MRLRRLLAVGVILLAASVGTAQATTIIDFEDLTRDPTFVPVPGDKVSGGFRFHPTDHFHIDGGATPVWSTTNGTTFAVEDFNQTLTFSPIAGGSFTLTSLDLSEAHEFARAQQVLVTGVRFGGGANPAPLTLTLDAFASFPFSPVNAFETFSVFGADWSNLESVSLMGTGIAGAYWGLDNIVLNDVVPAVPEPGTLTLLGLGSAYLIRRRRRNRQ